MNRRWVPLLIFFACPSSGCTYLAARGNDFADMWRLNAELGVLGLEADVHIGELAHIGVGMKGYSRYGLTYNMESESRDWAEIYPPVSFFYNWGKEPFALHYVHQLGEVRGGYVWWWKPYQCADDRCWLLLPPLTDSSGRSRNPWHLFDIEVSVFVLFFGIEIGFSPGEFIDFLLGIFGIDLAGDDDPEARQKRRLYNLPSVPKN